MTLDEAIEHCEEKAKCGDSCGMEHKQLAEWLKELKTLREENEKLRQKVELKNKLDRLFVNLKINCKEYSMII